MDRYGSTILDLFSHYASLLLKAATDGDSPGPLQMTAIVLEAASLCFMFWVFLTESDASFEERVAEEDLCPLDPDEVLNDATEMANLSEEEVEKLQTCKTLKDEAERQQQQQQQQQMEESGDYASVNVVS